jgi:hypothetical protein
MANEEKRLLKGADIIGKRAVSMLKERKIPYKYVRWKTGKTHHVLTVMLETGFRFRRFSSVCLIEHDDFEVGMVNDYLLKSLIDKLESIA